VKEAYDRLKAQGKLVLDETQTRKQELDAARASVSESIDQDSVHHANAQTQGPSESSNGHWRRPVGAAVLRRKTKMPTYKTIDDRNSEILPNITKATRLAGKRPAGRRPERDGLHGTKRDTGAPSRHPRSYGRGEAMRNDSARHDERRPRAHRYAHGQRRSD